MKGLLTNQYAIYQGGGDTSWAVDLTVNAAYMIHDEYIVDDNGDILFLDEDNRATYFKIIEKMEGVY